MGNSLLYGLPNNQIYRLSRLQNIAARIITRSNTRVHITPIVQDLHWLPIKDRIISKILVYVYRSSKGTLPPYLSEGLQPHISNRHQSMRSNNKHLSRNPLAITSWGEISFTSAAPSLWNDLPDHVNFLHQ